MSLPPPPPGFRYAEESASERPTPPPGFRFADEPPANTSVPKGLTWREDSQIAADNKGRRYAMVPVPRHLEEYRKNFGLKPRNAQVVLADETAGASPGTGSAGGMDTALFGMNRLIKDLNVSPEVAAGFMGSMWHESGGFKQMQEINPRAGRGGYGWAQWTGPRRRQYEAFTKERGLDPDSNEANYAFLHHDLTNTPEGKVVSASRGLKTPEQAAIKFTNMYERPGVPALGARQRHAREIYSAWQSSAGGGSRTPQAPAPTTIASSGLPPPPPGYRYAD